MKKIVGVRFRHTGKSFYYDPMDMDLSIGTGVIVKSEDGTEYGTVSIPSIEKEESELPAILKQIVRVANEEDEARVSENKRLEGEAYDICKQRIAQLELPMKLVHAEYTFERNKLLFYFTAEGRVDFRELVRILAGIFHTRIELRQIGVRDETKLLGGIGMCGRELCCNTYLSGFASVSIKMAKEQNLSLNPTKISGVCGRLMCCLNHEEETYEYLNRTMPKNGDYAVNVEGKVGVIRSVNILKQSINVIFEEGDTREMKEYPIEEVRIRMRREGEPTGEDIAHMKGELEAELHRKLAEEIERAIEVDADVAKLTGYTKRSANRGAGDDENDPKGSHGEDGSKDSSGRKDDKKKGRRKSSRRNPDRQKKKRGRPPKNNVEDEDAPVREKIKKKDRPNPFKKKRNDKSFGGNKKKDKNKSAKTSQEKRRNGGYSRGYRKDRNEG